MHQYVPPPKKKTLQLQQFLSRLSKCRRFRFQLRYLGLGQFQVEGNRSVSAVGGASGSIWEQAGDAAVSGLATSLSLTRAGGGGGGVGGVGGKGDGQKTV